jgi:hypothetical protein
MPTEPTGRRPPRQGRVRRLGREWRPSAITLGVPVLPLAVLFGLNAVDELLQGQVAKHPDGGHWLTWRRRTAQ